MNKINLFDKIFKNVIFLKKIFSKVYPVREIKKKQGKSTERHMKKINRRSRL